jgi:hypothetical protein
VVEDSYLLQCFDNIVPYMVLFSSVLRGLGLSQFRFHSQLLNDLCIILYPFGWTRSASFVDLSSFCSSQLTISILTFNEYTFNSIRMSLFNFI